MPTQFFVMKNKTGIIVLTLTLALVCIYNLSFTFVASHYRSKAESLTGNKEGNFIFAGKQKFLDSLWQQKVYLGNTLQQVSERELSLGLDLRGGMQVVLEVLPQDVIISLAGTNASSSQFKKALEEAARDEKTSRKGFISLFVSAYKESSPGRPLAQIFATNANREKINSASSDAEVEKLLESEFNQAVEVAFKIIRARVDKFGVNNPNIQRLPNSNRIMVELPGADNPDRIRKLLSGSAKLEFVEVYTVDELSPALNILAGYLNANAMKSQGNSGPLLSDSSKQSSKATSLESQLAEKQGQAKDSSLRASSETAFGNLFFVTSQGLSVRMRDTMQVNAILSRPEVRAMFPASLVFVWGRKTAQPDQDQQLISLYPVKKNNGQPAMQGSVIADASSGYDEHGRPEVTMQMNGAGARKWRELTAASVGKQIGIILDNQVYTAPVVNGEIPNGMSSITGNFTVDETKDLANVLKAGKLPAPTRIVEEAVIGSTLGTEAISSGLWSCAIGLLLVLTFMAVYYSKAGWVSNAALVLNLFFLLGVMASLGAVLTLAGIAGIVLTIGMSVDANVLIYEGIKGELEDGKPFSVAVKDGFKSSLSAIIDSNVTVLLTGLILFVFGSGLILGFATTLIIGLLTSLFTAIFIIKLLLDYAVFKGRSFQFHSKLTKNWFKDTHFDFLSQRKRFYTVAGVVLVIGIGSIIFKGFNLGIDFKGGRSYVIRYAENVQTDQVRKAMQAELGQAYLEVKTYGGFDQVKVTTDFKVDDHSPQADKITMDKILKAAGSLPSNLGTVQSSMKVGPTVALDTMTSAVWAVLLALVATFLYIFIRFGKLAFGYGALLALLHDVFVLLTIFSLFNGWLPFPLDIDQAFIGAILTIIGYSMNDKIVIFDRIRRYLSDPASKGENIPVIINNALNKTLNRTAVTGLTTMMVLVVLLIFGGEVLRSFTFAMLIGVIVGTYSSLFIAAPIVVDALLRQKIKEPAAIAVKRKLAGQRS